MVGGSEAQNSEFDGKVAKRVQIHEMEVMPNSLSLLLVPMIYDNGTFIGRSRSVSP